MKRARRHFQAGLTVIEMLVALLIGSIVLAAGTAFLINSSKAMRVGQEQAKNTSRAQQVLARLVKEIKSVNIETPPLFPATPAFTSLPRLPYLDPLVEKPFYDPVPATGTVAPLIMPATPAARLFASQAGATDMAHRWYPNPNPALNESNSLVCYKAPAPGAGGTSTIERITYRLVTQGVPNTAGFRSLLVREVQRPLSDSSVQFHGAPTPTRTVLAEDVLAIQFTYPLFEQAMNATLHTSLGAQAEPARTAYMNENFRKIIGIRIVMGGLQLGRQNTASVELETEVRLRSE